MNPLKLDGKKLSDIICNDLKYAVSTLKSYGVNPELVIVTSGDNHANKVYVRNKIKRCEEIGITPVLKEYDILTPSIVSECIGLGKPIIFQMPMVCKHENEINLLLENIDPRLDVDGFTSKENISRLFSGKEVYHYPCTPKAVIRLLDHHNIEISGKKVCIIGRSNIVGRPLAAMFEQRNATTMVCHSKTNKEDLENIVNMCDILVSATGTRNIVSQNIPNIENIVIVDVGINRDENGKICGDIDKELYLKSMAYTPVPGGIGPMTVAMLMQNVFDYYRFYSK